MSYDCWRGMVGMIKPTKGSGSLVELIKMLPDGIGVIPLFNNVRHGKIEEFKSAIPAYEEKIAELAEDKVDLIHPAGTPPFMLLGYEGEAEIIQRWERQFGIPIFTSGTNQVAAMKALKIKKFVGIGYDFDDTSIVARYFTRRRLRSSRAGKAAGPVGRNRTAFVKGHLLSSQTSVSSPSACRWHLLSRRQAAHSRYRRRARAGSRRAGNPSGDHAVLGNSKTSSRPGSAHWLWTLAVGIALICRLFR